MVQMEYWFGKKDGKPFYKFLEPCDGHPLYKPGDSWVEELGFGRTEMRNALKKICTTYKSKKEYTESQDKFKGKYYMSYIDKIRGITIYFRNNELIDGDLEKWSQKPDANVAIYGDIESESTEISKADLRRCENLIYGDIETESQEISKCNLQRDEKLIYGDAETESRYTGDYIQEITTEITQETNIHTNMQAGNQVETNRQNVFICYEQNFGTLVPQTIKDDIISYLEDGLEKELICHIIKRCAENQKKWPYAKSILNACVQDKDYTVQQFEIKREQFRAAKNQKETEYKKPQLVSKNPHFTTTYSHDWDFDELDKMSQDYLDRQLRKRRDEANGA